MSYGVHYRIAYKRLSNSTTTIDILENAYGGSVVNLTPDKTPLTITKSGDVNNIFAPTIGSGAVINVSATPLSLLNLFTSDPQQFVVKCYNGSSGSNLFWQGFVNAQIYSEDYSANYPIPISINCNDGMTILDSLYYKNSDGTFYTGCSTIGGVINNILGKLNITFNNIYTSNDISTNGYTVNLFTNVKVNNENYIDESLQAQTCREVLNSIMGGIPWVMYFSGDKIYIYDPINLNNSSIGKKYTLPAYTETGATVGGYCDIITGSTAGALGYYQTGQALDIVPICNEVDIKYNLYNYTNFNYDFSSVTGVTFSHITSPSPNDYYNNLSVNYPNWTQKTSGGTTASGHFIAIKQSLDDNSPIYGLLLDNSGDVLTYTIPHSYVNPSPDLSLALSIDSYCQTRLNSTANATDGENIYGSSATTPVYAYFVVASIQCGNLYFDDYSSWLSGVHGTLLGVIQDGVSYAQYGANNTKSIVNDTWATTKRIITLGGGLTGGTITVRISCIQGFSEITFNTSKPEYVVGAAYKRVLIKNLKLEVVNSAGVTISNNGINVKGNVSTSLIYKTNPLEISTTNGSTGSYGISRGSYLSNTNQSLCSYGFWRGGTPYMSEKLLLQAYISQYKVPRRKLSASLNAKNYLLDLNMKLITDYKYQSGKAFYIVNSTYDDAEESMDCEMIEVPSTKDSIT